MVQGSGDNNNGMIKNADSEITIIAQPGKKEKQQAGNTNEIMHPEQVYLQPTSDDSLSAVKRQPSSMSNIGLEMHPRIITKDASYSFIWIDDHYKDLSKLEEDQLKLKKQLSRRGFCNLFTIFFIISIILFLFIYPFISMFSK